MWNPVDPETVENPYPFWSWLRSEAPVYAVPDAGYYLVSRYDDVLRVCREPLTFSSGLEGLVQRDVEGRARLQRTKLVGQPQSRVLGVADGETHAGHRRAVGRTFSPSRMERMSSLAEEIAKRCVERFEGTTEVDLIEGLAIPLPRELMTRLLGLPLEDQPDLQAWTDDAMRLSGGLAATEEVAKSWEAIDRFQTYLAARFEEAIESPGEDVTGDLARAVRNTESGAEGLQRWEALAMLYQLVVGGIETTVGLIGTTIRHAVELPGEWARLREEPERIVDFVEEATRLDGPAIGNYRRTTRELELGGVKLPEGSTLTLLWGSANRDATQFPDPDRFVVGRPNIKTHLGFGHGTHFCLGAALARMETRVALQALSQRYERITLRQSPDSLRHKPSLGIRRLLELPIAIG